VNREPEHPITVLVVDDDVHVRELLKSFLEQQGHVSILAESAEDALALPDLAHVQVAMLDIRLPGTKDGHALQQELNRLYPDMAKILMSGQADLDDAISAFSEQAFSFVKKPFSSLKEIGILIERAAQDKALEIQNRDYSERLREANVALAHKVTERTAESQRYQNILAHLFQVSSGIGRIDQPNDLLDFICQAIVDAGAFRRAVVLLADESFRIQHVGVWQEGGVPESLRDALRTLRGQPLRPFEFERVEERVGTAVYARGVQTGSNSLGDALRDGWRPGDQLFMPVLRQDGSIFGYLSVEAPQDDLRPSEEIVKLLDVLLGNGALHLEAQELRDQLKQRAEELELRVFERTKELRLSEERFSRLVNSTTDIVYITDESDKLIFLNEAFTRTLGYVRENYIGRTMRRLLEDLTTENPINRRAIQDIAALTGDHAIHHVEILSRQGDKRTLEINRTIVRQGGEVRGSQGIVRDITEHRVLLQQLVNSERLAATGRLAAGIAHEINNPLQAVSSQLNAARRKLVGQESPAENLEVIAEGIDRIRHIVRSMLDLHRAPARPDSPVSLNEVVEKVVALVSQQVQERSVRLTLDLAADLPSVLGSPQELQQVALNLVLNAIEAMPGGGDLRIATRANPKSVELMVKDTGVGISEEHLPQIFEPFFTFKPTGIGTGLGLYLCKNIMDVHQGKINVESVKGAGATFTLVFPRR
jgi:PAS domain S-box-containing protein